MKAVILAGGLGTRLAEETHLKPKPMVEIGGMPILWHIMKSFSSFGISEFIICCGYKGYVIKDYFINYSTLRSDLTVDVGKNEISMHGNTGEDWIVTLIDTGEHTQTGGRLKRVKEWISDETFFFTYGDGLTDVNLSEELNFHKTHGKMATVLATRPLGRFGSLEISNEKVTGFVEKPAGDGGYINGGYFVLSPGVFDLIEGDETVWEGPPLKKLIQKDELMSFRHDGFWQPMDTLREKEMLERLWLSGNAPWKNWP